MFSSYYQPVLRASLKKAAGYPYPLYKRPPDMVEVALTSFGKGSNGEPPVLGRLGKDKRVTPYYSRDESDRRKALALNAGGAIKGPGRVDIYAGHGPQADATARYQWADGRLYVLVKKLPARDR